MTKEGRKGRFFLSAAKPLPWPLIFIFALLTATIAISGYLYYQLLKNEVLREQNAKLQAIADLKATEIRNWLDERSGNARLIMENPALIDELQSFLRDGLKSPCRDSVNIWMDALRNTYHYQNVLLLDRSGNVILALGDKYPAIGSEGLELLKAVQHEKKVMVSDLHESSQVAFLHLDVVAPILAADGILGFVFLRIDPADQLYPLIQAWPTPSPTAEILLVRRDGQNVLFLNDLRHRKDAALKLRVPLHDSELAAAQAFSGKRGVASGRDYRGKAVLSAARPITGTDWFIVAKVDRDEVEHPIRRYTQMVFLLALSLVLAAALMVLYLSQRQSARFRQRQLEAENKRQALVQHFDYLSRYANDIILLSDEKANILEFNDRALETYGYDHEMLLDMSLRGLRVPSERDKLLGQYRLAAAQNGLIFETVHQKKDGGAFPVEVSARQIMVQDKKYFQSIVRDISERKEAEAKLKHANRLYAVLSQVNQAIVRADGRDRLFQDICDVAVKYGGFRLAWIGLVDAEKRIVSPAFHSGYNTGYLDEIAISIDDIPAGRGPTGRAVRENRLVVCNDIRNDKKMDPWRDAAVQRGFLASAALPLRAHGIAIGALNLYVDEAGFFDSDQLNLLEEISGDIAYSLDAMENELQRRYNEKELRESEEKFKQVFEAANVAKSLTLLTGEIQVNQAFCDMLGFSMEELKLKKWQEITPEEDIPTIQRILEPLLKGQKKSARFNKRYIHKNGSHVWGDVNVAMRRDQAGRPLHFITTIVDITERKRAEDLIRASLVEKEVLLKEVHHRVKNNLMTIIGLIKMQETNADNKFISSMMRELEGRVRSMAQVHESLHKSRDLARVDLQEYIETLIDHIRAQFTEEQSISLRVHAAEVWVNLDIAVPCGLILNELITNAFKHAFPGGKPGRGKGACQIHVDVVRKGDYCTLTVADNGVGLPAGLDWEKSETLGLRLIRMLAQQIGCSIEMERSSGSAFHLHFKLSQQKN